MLIGAQYHRPPNPPREDWERDMRLMRENGLTVARTWLYWLTVNPKLGVWIWDEYDALFECAERAGLKILVQLMLDSPPYGFQDRHPEALFVDQDGKRIEFYAMQAQQAGGAPGPCFHNEAAKQGAEEYMRRVVERYREHPALFAWDVWNHIRIRECFCPATQQLFRDWLLKRYGSLEAINHHWRTNYGDVSEIRIAKHIGVYSPLIDIARFRRWVRADSMRWRADFVRALDPHHAVSSHTGTFSANCDPWMLTDPLDTWGVSSYPHDFHENSFLLDSARGAAKGKPWWLSEEPGGHLSFYLDERSERTPAQLRSLTLLAIGRGAKAAFFWQWRPELFGQESPHFGVTTVAGEPTPRTEAVGEIGRMLARRQEMFDGLDPIPPEVGLVTDLDTLVYEAASIPRRGTPKTFKTFWSDHFQGFYRALIDQGYAVEVLNARELAHAQVPAHLKMLVLPVQVIERPGLMEKLASWVEAGGTLVAGPLCGLYDPDTFTNRMQPPTLVAELFGVAQDGDIVFESSPQIELLPHVVPGISGGSIPGVYLVQPFRPQKDTVKVLGISRDRVALTWTRHGKGAAVMLGGLVGGLYSRTENPGLAALLDALCWQAGVRPPAKATGGVMTQVARAGEVSLLFVHNPLKAEVDSWVSLAEPIAGPVVDLLSETTLTTAKPGQPFVVHLGPRDSRVFSVGASSR